MKFYNVDNEQYIQVGVSVIFFTSLFSLFNCIF